MTDTSKANPRPWKFTILAPSEYKILDDRDVDIGEFYNADDAAKCILAVNAHDDLVEALEPFANALFYDVMDCADDSATYCPGEMDVCPIKIAYLRRAYDALTKARGDL